ncbi:MAG TPA: SIR2 family protein, partial [Flavisolibacter sp.]|nr:SIR2 family protein [Flavisolibacter sp.]
MNKILSEQSDWDELLEFISEKQLTPVIGKELYKFTEADSLIPFDEYLSKQLLQANGVTGLPPLPLTKAVSYLLNERRLKPMEVTRKLKTLVKEIRFDFPLLSQLLEITDLHYFINTSVYNNVLEQKFKEVRNSDLTSINFSINEPFSDCDDLEKLKQPFVFNVFGSLLNTVDAALSEEDMLEYTGYFKEKLSGAANIINALRNHNLLFIGCAFPDWMVRFILRLLSAEPLQEWGTRRTIVVINDKSDVRQTQFDYLRTFDVVTYEGSTADFMQELSERWKQK